MDNPIFKKISHRPPFLYRGSLHAARITYDNFSLYWNGEVEARALFQSKNAVFSYLTEYIITEFFCCRLNRPPDQSYHIAQQMQQRMIFLQEMDFLWNICYSICLKVSHKFWVICTFEIACLSVYLDSWRYNTICRCVISDDIKLQRTALVTLVGLIVLWQRGIIDHNGAYTHTYIMLKFDAVLFKTSCVLFAALHVTQFCLLSAPK